MGPTRVSRGGEKGWERRGNSGIPTSSEAGRPSSGTFSGASGVAVMRALSLAVFSSKSRKSKGPSRNGLSIGQHGWRRKMGGTTDYVVDK